MSDRTWLQEQWIGLCRWLAFRLPHAVVYFAALRLIDHAAPEYPQQHRLSIEDALRHWDWSAAQIADYWKESDR